jgi:ABC-type Zn uptake system ZnuABC Zn-binding protein ZnuA
MMTMTRTIAAKLGEVDPANAGIYEANAEGYVAELKALDAWVVEAASAVPYERRKLVTTHNTFQYFGRRYGYEIAGTALGATTEASDPSAGEIAVLVGAIQANGIQAVFPENIGRSSLMEQVAAAAGVRLGAPLYTDALGSLSSPGATYDGLMRHNVAAIVAALS